ncbi:unnamed protein product [Caenorhabditis angaria]|uniref:Uncharacterized protein n=1 Tax=Caenorhabditis angaria TaxID=860376 RepID=A0A9P1ILV6_9PELO|nr:unnamed protein product [Caenorhabditis angaria]
MILSLITILSISILNSDSIDPEECMKNYINSIQNQTFKHFLTDDFAIYNCGGKPISYSDFQREALRKLWDGLSPIPIREYKIKSVNQTKFNVEVQFSIRGEKKVANIEIETTISDDKVCRIKSERQKKYFSRDRKYYSSFLIDYEKLFGKKAQNLLEEYIGNLEIGKFSNNFKIVRRFSKNSTAIQPLLKLIHKKIPTISSNRYFIEQSYEPNLDFLVTIDDGKLKVEFFVVINDQGDFEIRIERQPHWETQESIIPWFTSAFIDYPRTYERIVEELIEKFRNSIKTKEIEDDIFSILNLTSSEMGYFSSFYSVLYYDSSLEKQQFSYQNYDEKQLDFSIKFENNKFNLLIDEEMTMVDYFNRIYEDIARNLMDEYKNVLCWKIKIKKFSMRNSSYAIAQKDV